MATQGMIYYLFWIAIILILSKAKSNACFNSKGCRYNEKNNHYYCFKTVPWNKTTPTVLNNAKVLELCDIVQDTLDLHVLAQNFPNINSLKISQANLTNLSGNLKSMKNLKVLILNNLTIEEFPSGILNGVDSIQVLDLRNNSFEELMLGDVEIISKINITFLRGRSFGKNEVGYLFRNRGSIYMQSNNLGNPWDCSLDLNWILKLNSSNVKDLEKLKCFNKPYPGKPVIEIARFKHNVNTNCPSECECSLPDVVRDPSNLKLVPIIEVNCSDRGLTELPLVIPTQTKILILKRNNIISLKPLIVNKLYRGIEDLYFDNNYIDNIQELEDSYWLSHFRVLSLRNNKLTQLPTYALDNALQRNPNMPVAVRIYFGYNPWRCDCVFTPGFQEMLQKYEAQVKDIDDIKCSYVEGDENSLTLISELSRSSVCRLSNEYSIRILDLLNGILATLIVLILGKLGYDYYHFKKTGRLPWIVTKMP